MFQAKMKSVLMTNIRGVTNIMKNYNDKYNLRRFHFRLYD